MVVDYSLSSPFRTGVSAAGHQMPLASVFLFFVLCFVFPAVIESMFPANYSSCVCVLSVA